MSHISFPLKARTKISWAGEEEGDLGFIENEVLEVFSFVDESWWCGRLKRNGAEGIFPKEYVEVIETELKHSESSNSFTYSKGGDKRMDKAFLSGNAQVSEEKDKILTSAVRSFISEKGQRLPHTNKAKSPPKGYNGSLSPEQLRTTNHCGEDLMIQRKKEIENFRKLKEKEYRVKHLSNSTFTPSNRNSMINLQTQISPKVRLKNANAERNEHIIKNNAYLDDEPEDDGEAFYLMFIDPVTASPSKGTPHKSRKNQDQILKNSTSEQGLLGLGVEQISLKRKQLEMELKNLKRLEEIVHQHSSQEFPLSLGQKESRRGSVQDNYLNEDYTDNLISLEIPKVRTDFSSARSSDFTTKLFEEQSKTTSPASEEGSNLPPPPPPKHGVPRPLIEKIDFKEPQHDEALPALKVPYDASDFILYDKNENKVKLNENDILLLSQLQINELRNSANSLPSDVLNLSELSATSAGSFIRHKLERDLKDNENPPSTITDLKGGNSEVYNRSVMETIFQDKKSRHPNIFRKLLQKKGEGGLNQIEQKLQKEENTTWMEVKSELNRMNSLTSYEKQQRSKRAVREENSLILRPLDYISDINADETSDAYAGDIDFSALPYRKIDLFIRNYEPEADPNELLADISVKFSSSSVCKIRAILLHLCKFRIIEESGSILRIKPNLREVVSKKEASVFQLNYLFKKFLDALRIPNEIVYGFWKKPNEFYHAERYVINHCWLSIFVEEQFLLMDLLSFKCSELCNIHDSATTFNEFYFLAKPRKLISTHIPSIIDLQHVVPPIDQNIAFYLPRNYSGFYKNGLIYRNFNNSLTRLKNLEFFEMEVCLPVDVELFALVKTSKITTNELCICQVFWSDSKRVAKIKAILPEDESIGVLQVFAGPKGLQKHFENIHELAIVVPLVHTGSYKPCEFVPRFPTVQCTNYDIYIKQPQISRLIVKNSYNFSIMLHPSNGLSSMSRLQEKSFRVVIEAPTGKYYNLEKADSEKPFGSYQCLVRCNEVGHYRGLILGDSGSSWHVFAQWECVSGALSN